MSEYTKTQPEDLNIITQKSNDKLFEKDQFQESPKHLEQILENSTDLKNQAKILEHTCPIPRKLSDTEVPAMEASAQESTIKNPNNNKNDIKMTEKPQKQDEIQENQAKNEEDQESHHSNENAIPGDWVDIREQINYSNILNVSKSHQNYSLQISSFYVDDTVHEPQIVPISYEICALFLNISVIALAVLGFGMSFSDNSLQLFFQILFGLFYLAYILETFFKSETFQYLRNIVTKEQLNEYLQKIRKAQPSITIETQGQEVTPEGARNNIYHEKKELEIRKVSDLSSILEIQNFAKKNKHFRLQTTYDCNVADKSLKVLRKEMTRDAEAKGSQFVTDKIIYNLEGKVPFQISSQEGKVSGLYSIQMYAVLSILGFTWVYRMWFQISLPVAILHVQKVINGSL